MDLSEINVQIVFYGFKKWFRGGESEVQILNSLVTHKGSPFIYIIRCSGFVCLILVKSGRNPGQKDEISAEKFWRFGKKSYLCTRFREIGSKERVL